MVLEVGMESPESYVSSPEVTDSYNRSPTPQNGTNPDDKEKPTSIRFLVSNAEAGSVIGKGGSTITEFQLQSRTRIQLSRNHEYFPGTTDRIIMVTGGVNEILTAVELILLKLESESHSEDADAADSMSKMRLIVPNSSCGGIIGKGGSTIKSFTEDSQAGIKISPQDHGFTGVSDRVVTVTGSLEEKLRALHLIVDKLAADSHYSQYANSPLSYTGANFSGVHNLPAHSIVPSVYNTVNYGSKGASGKLSYSKTRASNQTATFGSRPTAKMQPNSEGCGTEMGILTSVMALEPFNGSREIQNSPASKPVTLGIADEHIGLVVGRGGRNIAKVTQVSGARIKISDRGDFISGTSNRKVTISGTKDAIRVAQTLIEQRIASFLSEDSLANVGSGKSAECN